MTTATEHPHVVAGDEILDGEPTIKGTRTLVRAVVETWRSRVAADDIPKRLPHLSLAQVFDALSYYCDHQEEINACIERVRTPAATGEGGRVHLVGPGSAPLGGNLKPVIPEGSWEEHEKAKLMEALDRANGSITRAAPLLGMSFRTLQYRLDKFGIKRT